jgi:hypothetical protein
LIHPLPTLRILPVADDANRALALAKQQANSQRKASFVQSENAGFPTQPRALGTTDKCIASFLLKPAQRVVVPLCLHIGQYLVSCV